MAPIPTKRKINQAETTPVAVSTTEVHDDIGRSLDSLIKQQDDTNRKQTDNISVNRQHAAQYESNTEKNKLVYRDVFPGRKYKLTLNDTTWMGGDNKVTIGYTVGSTFTQVSQTATAPDDNVFSIELPIVAAIDTLEVRFTGASSVIRGYLEDSTTSSSISGSIAGILNSIADLIRGGESVQQSITLINQAIEGIQGTLSSLDERVTALEQEQEPTE